MKNKYLPDRKKWYKENAPFGKLLGYPDCCIIAFCNQTPMYLKKYGTTYSDKMRLKASYINGKYSGFIPCEYHARLINNKWITLESLIKNRSKKFPPFPNV